MVEQTAGAVVMAGRDLNSFIAKVHRMTALAYIHTPVSFFELTTS